VHPVGYSLLNGPNSMTYRRFQLYASGKTEVWVSHQGLLSHVESCRLSCNSIPKFLTRAGPHSARYFAMYAIHPITGFSSTVQACFPPPSNTSLIITDIIAGKDRTGIAAALLLLVSLSHLVSILLPRPTTLTLAKTPPARWRQQRRYLSRLCLDSYRA
jgi:hypothetical protein